MGSSAKDKMPYGTKVRERYRDDEGFAAQEQIPFSLGVGAEMMATRWGLSRPQLDEYSLASHEKAAAASFASELAPYAGVRADEGIRRDTTLAKLGSLSTPFKADGVVTAGSASQISDGAAALAVTTSEYAARHGLTPLARIHTAVVAGDDPVIMLTAPIPATKHALSKAGMTLDDIDLVEINEAFASVVLAWQKELDADLSKVNVNGGAIALGHPLGATGVRLMTTLLNELERTGGRYGLQTMCEGGGQANVTIIERL
jgi:acetyl-CoA acyltransferase